MTTILTEFFRHNRWANLGLIDACASASADQLAASVPGTFGSIQETLVHLVAAEERYLARFLPPTATMLSEEAAPPTLAEIREHARRSGEGLIAVAERMTADEVMRGSWRDQPYAIPASTFLIQAINHATDHRSQICTILTQHGVTPPDLDGWTFDESRSQNA